MKLYPRGARSIWSGCLSVLIFLTGVQSAKANHQCSGVFSTLDALVKYQPFSVPPKIVRGFARSNYGAREITEMIFRNHQYDLRSWALEKAIKKIEKDGQSHERVSTQAHMQVLGEITDQLKAKGFDGFYEQQMNASYVGLSPEQKSSAVLFAGPPSSESALSYARFAFWKQASDLNFPKHLPMQAIVFEIESQKVQVISHQTDFEYMILSRVDSSAVSGVYIGYPHYIGESFAPRGIDYDWYYFKVNRNSGDEVFSIEIYEARETFKGMGLALRNPDQPIAVIDRERQVRVLGSILPKASSDPVSELASHL